MFIASLLRPTLDNGIIYHPARGIPRLFPLMYIHWNHLHVPRPLASCLLAVTNEDTRNGLSSR